MAKTPLKDRAAAAAALARIADFLDVPIALFYEPAPETNGCAPADLASQAEIRELVRHFQRMHDPKARGRCLAYVRRLAEEASQAAGQAAPHPPGGAGHPSPGLKGS